ncbi:MAG: MBOAT family protein [Lachnospiraceae bacterium]|nr:MBOAT family protein [Lachnospiraceae bacterium]
MGQMNTFLSFTGLDFLFRFLPVFMAVFYLTPKGHKNKVLFAGSLIFYAMGSMEWAGVLLALTLVNAALAKAGSVARGRLMIAFDLLIFAGIKAAAFFIPDFSVPFGMSFYILRMISYQHDLSCKRLEKKNDLWTVAAYFTAFMHLPQGPVASYRQMNDAKLLPSLTGKAFLERAENGISLVVAGLCMKVLLADKLSMMWNNIFRIGFESISTPLAWLGALCYSLLLYYDFWGYSLIAAGLGMMMGYEYIPNFDHPYAAGSVSSFYRKWHISLGTFFKNCLYIPLGGSRQGRFKTILNIMIVWLATGLWHMGSLNYLIWAGALCLIILWEKTLGSVFLKKLPLIGHLHVLLLIPLSWIVFAMPDVASVEVYFLRLFPFAGEGINVSSYDVVKLLGSYFPYLIIAIVGCIPKVTEIFVRLKDSFLAKAVVFGMFWLCVYEITRMSGNPFMYIDF